MRRWLRALSLLPILALASCLVSPDPRLLASRDSSLEAQGRDVILDLPGQDRGRDQPADAALPTCALAADSLTLALYSFESPGPAIVDATGAHDGTAHGAITEAEGPPGCGKAVRVALGDLPDTDYIEIPSSPAWQLEAGAVELWVRFDKEASLQNRGILSRDALGTKLPGHLSILRTCDGAVVVRHQNGAQSLYQCSPPLPDETWIHVAVNFGSPGLELFIDGKRASRTDAIKELSSGGQCVETSGLCGTATIAGIAGNDNPWSVGALNWGSEEGLGTPVSNQLGGAIDSLRISSARRPFEGQP